MDQFIQAKDDFKKAFKDWENVMPFKVCAHGPTVEMARLNEEISNDRKENAKEQTADLREKFNEMIKNCGVSEDQKTSGV